MHGNGKRMRSQLRDGDLFRGSIRVDDLDSQIHRATLQPTMAIAKHERVDPAIPTWE